MAAVEQNAQFTPEPTHHGRWMGRLRLVFLAIVAVLTIFGAYKLGTGDWQGTAAYWLARRRLLLMCFLLSACDVFTDGFIWTSILWQRGIRLGARRTMLLFLSGYAGYLMPAQLGRFFRATELSRIYKVPLADSTTAELTLLAFVVVSCVSIFSGALVSSWSLPVGMAVPLPLFILLMFLAEAVSHRIPKLPFKQPVGYWRHPVTLFLCMLSSTGWLLNGLILFLIFRGVAAGIGLNHTIMIVTSNLFVGISSGLPGGMGITEAYIGGMMYWLDTPPEHLVIAVAAFRILTFWLWIPIGWLALFLNSVLYGSNHSLKEQAQR